MLTLKRHSLLVSVLMIVIRVPVKILQVSRTGTESPRFRGDAIAKARVNK